MSPGHDPSTPPEGATRDATPAARASTAAETAATARRSVVGAAIVAVVAGAVVAYVLWRWLRPPAPTPVEGVGVFAALYVLAQAIERLLEPFSQFVLPSASLSRQRGRAVAEAERDPADATKREAAALATVALEQRRADRAIAFWALATVLGMLASAVLGLRLLRLVGVTTAPAAIEIMVTGLAVGGGSKPLHDLITRLERSKEKTQDEHNRE